MLPTGSPRTMSGLVAGGRRFPGATNPRTFETLGLSPALLRALSESGYTTPTPIQLEAIPLALAGHDLLGGAQTGTGKTAAFGLPLLQRLSKLTPPNGARKPRALRPAARRVGKEWVSTGRHRGAP